MLAAPPPTKVIFHDLWDMLRPSKMELSEILAAKGVQIA
jgi:hypothetical protein